MAAMSFRSALYDLFRSDLLACLGDGYMPHSPDGEWGVLPTDCAARQFAALHCAKSLVKKFQDEIDQATTDRVALEKFLAANESCRMWEPPRWADPSLRGGYEAELYGEWREQMRHFFETAPETMGAAGAALVEEYPDYDWGVVLDASKIVAFANSGPGSSVGAIGCTFAEKFDASHATYGDDHIKWLWELKTESPTWRDLEISRQMRGLRLNKVAASKLTFVPKTVSESRTICVEPLLNTFFQKGAGFLLERQLKLYFGIDLSNQQAINRELARIGSIDGSYATIDLTSASDTIAYALVKDSVPAHQFKYLNWLRTRCAQFDGESIELQMFSTMGNAFTFPLQTAIFAAAVRAVYRIRGIPARSRQRRSFGIADQKLVYDEEFPTWGCNGDDIVVVREAYDDVVNLLKLLGFTPNLKKSFSEGWFRESCGADWYKGVNVRGVYCQHAKTEQDINSLINRLMTWSVEHDIGIPNTLGWLKGRLKRPFLVPMFEEETSGIRVPFTATPKRKRSRIQEGREREWAYQKWDFFASGFSYDVVEDGVGLSTWPFSPVGTILSILRGDLRGCFLARRKESDRNGRYRAVWRWAPAWDSTPLVGGQWKHCLVPLTEDYKLRYYLKLLTNRIVG